MCSSSTGGKPAASGVSFEINDIGMATTVQSPDGIQKSQRQCSGGTYHKPRNTKPASNAGPKVLMINRPALIMKPKMPAKRPRSVLANQAALIFTMPGAPNDCR